MRPFIRHLVSQRDFKVDFFLKIIQKWDSPFLILSFRRSGKTGSFNSALGVDNEGVEDNWKEWDAMREMRWDRITSEIKGAIMNF